MFVVWVGNQRSGTERKRREAERKNIRPVIVNQIEIKQKP